MFCGLNAKKNHCLISNIENLATKVWSVKYPFLLSIYALSIDPYQPTLADMSENLTVLTFYKLTKF